MPFEASHTEYRQSYRRNAAKYCLPLERRFRKVKKMHCEKKGVTVTDGAPDIILASERPNSDSYRNPLIENQQKNMHNKKHEQP